jgi:hypothetical protein
MASASAVKAASAVESAAAVKAFGVAAAEASAG